MKDKKPQIEYRVGSKWGQGYYVLADSAEEALRASGFHASQEIQDVIIWKIDGKMTRLSRAYQQLGDRAGREPEDWEEMAPDRCEKHHLEQPCAGCEERAEMEAERDAQADRERRYEQRDVGPW